MSERQFVLGPTTQMERRERQAAEFCSVVFDPGEGPRFVSVAVSLWDIYGAEERDLIRRCREHYGVWLRREHFSLPLRELLDYLAQHWIR